MKNSESLNLLLSPSLMVNNECFLGWGEEVGGAPQITDCLSLSVN